MASRVVLKTGIIIGTFAAALYAFNEGGAETGFTTAGL